MLRRKLANNIGVKVDSCGMWRSQARIFSSSLFSSMSTFVSITTMNSRHNTDNSASITNIISNSIVNTSRRSYYSRQLDTTVTVQRKDGKTYPALLSWNWSKQRPRHLVVKITEPASTYRNAQTDNKKGEETLQKTEDQLSSANKSDNNAASKDSSDSEFFTSHYSESSPSAPSSSSSFSTTSDVQPVNLQNDDPYFFGRLFLRIQNVAELLAVLIGWSPSAQIERERAGLMLRPASFASQKCNDDSKTDSTTSEQANRKKDGEMVRNSRAESEETLSRFTLTGYFTKKTKVHEPNEKYTDGKEVTSQGSGTPHGRNESEEEAVYVDNELCTISVTLQTSELILLKNFLDNTMSNIFGIEYFYHRKITEQMLEKQRRSLSRRSYYDNSNREITANHPPRYRSEMPDHFLSNHSSSIQPNLQPVVSMRRRNSYLEFQPQQHQRQPLQQQEKEEYLYEEQQMRQKRGGNHYSTLAQVKEDYTRPFVINDKSSCILAKNDKSRMTDDKNNNNTHNTPKENLVNVKETPAIESASLITATATTAAAAVSKNEIQSEKKVDDTDREIYVDEKDSSKAIEAEIDDICDVEYEEADEDDEANDEDDAINNAQVSKHAEGSNLNAIDNNAQRMNGNCEIIADEEAVRDTDELDAEEVDADEEIVTHECVNSNQQKSTIKTRVPVTATEGEDATPTATTIAAAAAAHNSAVEADDHDNDNNDGKGEENVGDVLEEYEEVIDEDIAAETTEMSEQVEENEGNIIDQIEVYDNSEEISEISNEIDAADNLTNVDKRQVKEEVDNKRENLRITDERITVEKEQVHEQMNAELGNTAQRTKEEEDMEIEEIEEIIEEEIEEVEDEYDNNDSEHIKTLSSEEKGGASVKMNADGELSKSSNTSEAITAPSKRTTQDGSAADVNDVCATDISVPNVTKFASKSQHTNKSEKLEHTAQISKTDNIEPVMEVKANASRTLATKVANIREQGASEVNTEKDMSNNLEQPSESLVHPTDEEELSKHKNLQGKSAKITEKSGKANAVASSSSSSSKRSMKKNSHASHSKKSTKKGKKQPKGNKRIVV